MKTNLFTKENGRMAMVILLCVLAVAGAVSLIRSGIEAVHQQKDERELSANVMQVTRDGVSSIVNSETGKTLIRNIRVDWIQEGHDSLAVFSKDKLRGYFNIRTGEVVVEPKYKHAWIFSEGLAGVVRDGMVGFINCRGEEVIPCRFPYHGNSLYEFVFKGGHCVVADTTQLIGVIDSLGQWAIAPRYKHIALSKNYALVTTDEGFKQQISFDGKVLSDCVVDYVNTLNYQTAFVDRETGQPSSSYTICEDFYEYVVDSRCGLMSVSGEFITAPIYSNISALGPRTFRATLPDTYSEVIINEKGQVLSRKNAASSH